jgi:putative addiction module CopG family antidote
MPAALPPEFENYVQQAVSAGQYRSTEDAVYEAFRLLQVRDAKVQQLRHDVRAGFDQLERGESIECDDAGLEALFAEIERQHADRTATLPRSAP